MADIKINGLTLAGAVVDGMQFESDVGGTVANKVTSQQIKAYVKDGLAGGEVAIDNSGFSVLTGSESQTLWEQNDTALLNARATGIRFGSEVTGLGTATIDISAGAGQILNNIDPENPIYNPETWAAETGRSVSDGLNWVYVDAAGDILIQTTDPTAAEYRTKIFLARVSVTGGLVSGIQSIVVPVQQDGANLRDLYDALGTIKSGQMVGASGANLNLAINSGFNTAFGANFYNDPLSPNRVELAAFDSAGSSRFRMVTQDAVVPTDVAVLPVGSYDNAGVITAIGGSGSRSTIFTVYRFASGNVRILYGQEIYTSLANATAAIPTYNPVAPAGFENAVILGYIAVERSSTDLSDGSAVFVNTNKFGERA